MELQMQENDDFVQFNDENVANIKYLSFKQRIFQVCYSFVPKTYPSPIFASALIMISLLQLLGIIFAIDYPTGLSNFFLIRITQAFCGMTELEALGSSVLYYFCIFALFVCMSSLIINAILNCSMNSTAFIARLLPLIYWIGAMPISELLVSVLQCNDTNHHIVLTGTLCWSLTHIIISVLTLVMILPWLLILALSTLISSYSESLKADPFAHFPWKFEIFYIFCRLLFVLNVRILRQEIVQIFLIALTLILFLSVIWNSYPYYDPTVSHIFTSGSLCIISGCVVVFLYYLFDLLRIDNGELMPTYFILCFFIFILIWWSQKRHYFKIFVKNKVSSIYEQDSKIHMFHNMLTQGTIFFRFQDECIENLRQNSFNDTLPSLLLSKNVSQTSLIDKETSETKELLVSLIYNNENENSEHKANVEFLLQMSGVYLHIMKNTSYSYSKVIEAEKLEPGFVIEFALYMRKLDIISKIVEKKQKEIRKFGYSKFQSTIQFEAEYKNFIKKMVSQANLRLDFWNCLRTKPSLTKLHKLGMETIKLNAEVLHSFELLTSISKRYVPMLKLYKKYLKSVIGNQAEADIIRKQLRNCNIEPAHKSLSPTGIFSDKVAVIIITPDSKILRANKATEPIFMWNRRQLCGKPVSILMPSIIGKEHPKFMDTFFKTGIDREGGKQFVTFGINHSGFLIPVKVAKQQFCSLTLGLLYIGTVEVENLGNDEYIITDANGAIRGTTRDIAKRLKFTSSLIADRKVNITRICPEISKEQIKDFSGEIMLNFASYSPEINVIFRQPTRPRKRNTSLLVGRVGENTTRTISKPPGRGTSSIRLMVGELIIDHVEKEMRKSIREYEFCSKCEISTETYSSGLIIKVFKLEKIIEGEGQKAPNAKIGSEVIGSISTILRAIRKFKAKLSQRHKKQKEKINRNSSSSQSLIFAPEKKSNNINGPVIESDDKQIDLLTNITKLALVNAVSRNGSKKERKKKTSKKQDLLISGSGLNEESPETNKDMNAQEIIEMRKKTIDDFQPKSVNNMKITTQFFMLLVLILLFVRMFVSVSLNTYVVNLSSLMYYNCYRVNHLAAATAMIQSITMYFPYKRTNTTLMNLENREGRYNYSQMLETLKFSNKSVDYKGFTTESSYYYLRNTLKYEDDIEKALKPYRRSLIEQINVLNLTLDYMIENKKVSSQISMVELFATIIATFYKFLDYVVNGTYTNNYYMADMIINAILVPQVKGTKPILDILVNEAYSQVRLHEAYSTSTFICLIALYSLYFVILIPFLFFTRKDLSSTLMLLLDIPRYQIHSEYEKINSFKRKINKDDRMVKADILVEENVDEEEDKLEIEENSNKEESKSEIVEHEIKKKESKRTRNNRPYVAYSNDVWKVLLLFALFYSIAIAIYFALDYVSKLATVKATFKVTELRHLARNLNANFFTIPYVYSYILSNKTAICGASPCSVYLTTYFNLRLAELNTMVILHKANTSLVGGEYERLYQNLFQYNPCAETDMKKIANCSTFMGGAFTKGTAAANIMFSDTLLAVFRDFERNEGTVKNIARFSNDKRLIDMEILNTMYIAPAMCLMVEYIMKILPIELKEVILLTVLMLMAFLVVFIASTCIWLVWLINFMRNSIFDTKSLLSYLPDDVILRNDSIFLHLSKMLKTLN